MQDFLANLTARFGVLKGVLPLSRAAAARDALAGVQLASMDIPQVLGYARIAGMPAVSGLYTAFLPLIAFAFFGASRHLVVAADSATATIFASRLSTMAPASSAEYAALAGMVALLTAGLLFIARIFKLGFLADFLSRTVLVGFLAGVGVQVGIAMLGDMVGLTAHASRSIDQLLLVVRDAAHVNLPTLAISVLVVRRHSGLQTLFSPPAGAVDRCRRRDCRERYLRFRGPRHLRAGAGSGRLAAARHAVGDVAATARSAARRGVLLRDDRRAKRRCEPRFRRALSRIRRYQCRPARPRRSQRGGGFVGRVRGQRQSDPNRDGRSRRHPQPVRAGRVRARGRRGAAVFQPLSAVSAALHSCQHRVHDRGGPDRCEDVVRDSSRKSRRVHAGSRAPLRPSC